QELDVELEVAKLLLGEQVAAARPVAARQQAIFRHLPAAGRVGYGLGDRLGVLELLAVGAEDGIAAAGLGDLGVLDRRAVGIHRRFLAVHLGDLGAVDRLALGVDDHVLLVELALL